MLPQTEKDKLNVPWQTGDIEPLYNYQLHKYQKIIGLGEVINMQLPLKPSELTEPTDMEKPALIQIFDANQKIEFVGFTVEHQVACDRPTANHISVWGCHVDACDCPHFQWLGIGMATYDGYTIAYQEIVLPWLHTHDPTSVLDQQIMKSEPSRADQIYEEAAKTLANAIERYDSQQDDYVTKEQHNALLGFRIASSFYDPNHGSTLMWAFAVQFTTRPQTVEAISIDENIHELAHSQQLPKYRLKYMKKDIILPAWRLWQEQAASRMPLQNKKGQLQRYDTFAVTDNKKFFSNCGQVRLVLLILATIHDCP